jgi:amino acid transporter
MGMVGICWYICGAFAVLHVLTLLMSYAPHAQSFGTMLQVVSGSVTLVACAGAIGLGRLRRDHWIRRSRPLRALLVGVAVVATVALLIMLGG